MATPPDIPELEPAVLRSDNRSDYSAAWERFLLSLDPFRSGMMAVRDFIVALVSQSENEYVFGGADTGIADAYVIAPVEPISSYQAGQGFYFFAETDNGGASTLRVSGILPAQDIKLDDGSDPSAGDISGLTKVMHNGTHFVLLKKVGGGAMAEEAVIARKAGADVNVLTFPSVLPLLPDFDVKFVVLEANTGAVTINGVTVSTTEDVDTNLVGGELEVGQIHKVVPIGVTPDRYYLISATKYDRRAVSNGINGGANLALGVDHLIPVDSGGGDWDLAGDHYLDKKGGAKYFIVSVDLTLTGNRQFYIKIKRNGVDLVNTPAVYVGAISGEFSYVLKVSGSSVSDEYKVYAHVPNVNSGTVAVAAARLYIQDDV